MLRAHSGSGKPSVGPPPHSHRFPYENKTPPLAIQSNEIGRHTPHIFPALFSLNPIRPDFSGIFGHDELKRGLESVARYLWCGLRGATALFSGQDGGPQPSQDRPLRRKNSVYPLEFSPSPPENRPLCVFATFHATKLPIGHPFTKPSAF